MKVDFEELLGSDTYNNMVRRYNGHCASVVGRTDKLGNPIEMRMTFEEWLSVWIDSGKAVDRGRGLTQFVMCRNNDIGHYEIGNVFIASSLDNIIDAHNMLTDYERHINNLCLKTGYKRRIIKGLIKRGRITINDDGSVTVH